MLFELEEETAGARDLLYRVNALRFARERLGFSPDEKQAAVMSGKVRRGLLNCTRQWGKSTVTAAMAVHRAWSAPDSLTIVVSPSGRQSAEFLRKANRFASRLGIRARGDGDNEISLLFPNGARIVGLPGAESTVRGFSAVTLMLIDEAARVDDDLYKAVRPFLAVADGDLWLMSTPNGKRGFFYEEWANGGPRWKRFTVTALDCPRISREFWEEEKAAMGERWFRQEYMCEFVDVDEGLFSGDVIERAFSEDVRELVL